MSDTQPQGFRINKELENAHYKMIRDLNLPSRSNYWRVKRWFDIVFSALALIVFSPFLLLLCIAIVIDDPKGGPFYTQIRCGRGGRPFRMIKLRSMITTADEEFKELARKNEVVGPVFKMKNDPRVTRVGRLMRATSLDEFPQFINILKGDMSIVGPRPPLPSEVAQYNEYQFQRLYVTPGLTCFWQIAPNRNEISFDAWVEMDVEYIMDRSWWVDIKIIFHTVFAVFRRSGK